MNVVFWIWQGCCVHEWLSTMSGLSSGMIGEVFSLQNSCWQLTVARGGRVVGLATGWLPMLQWMALHSCTYGQPRPDLGIIKKIITKLGGQWDVIGGVEKDKWAIPGNPQATPAREAGGVTVNLHVSLWSPKSDPPDHPQLFSAVASLYSLSTLPEN